MHKGLPICPEKLDSTPFRLLGSAYLAPPCRTHLLRCGPCTRVPYKPPLPSPPKHAWPRPSDMLCPLACLVSPGPTCLTLPSGTHSVLPYAPNPVAPVHCTREYPTPLRARPCPLPRLASPHMALPHSSTFPVLPYLTRVERCQALSRCHTCTWHAVPSVLTHLSSLTIFILKRIPPDTQ